MRRSLKALAPATRRSFEWMRRRCRPVLALVGALLLVVAATGARMEIDELRRTESVTHLDLDRQLMQVQASASANAVSPTDDFTHALPDAVPLEAFVQALQRSATAFNAAIMNVSGEQQAGTARTLPRLVVSITLRGTYAAIKSTLAEALSRYPGAVFSQLSMKRDAAVPGGEEATIRLVLPLRPTASRVD